MTVTSDGARGSTAILNRPPTDAGIALPKASLARIRIVATPPPLTAPSSPSPTTVTLDGSTAPCLIFATNGAALGIPTPPKVTTPVTSAATSVK